MAAYLFYFLNLQIFWNSIYIDDSSEQSYRSFTVFLAIVSFLIKIAAIVMTCLMWRAIPKKQVKVPYQD